jgi:hypothetical protein
LTVTISSVSRKSIWPVEAKLDFENYKGNELEMGHYRPIIEAERDETLSQYLQERGQKTPIFSFSFEASG